MPTDHAIFWAEVERGERVASDEIIRVWMRAKASIKAYGNVYNVGEVLNLRGARAILWGLVDAGAIEEAWPEKKK